MVRCQSLQEGLSEIDGNLNLRLGWWAGIDLEKSRKDLWMPSGGAVETWAVSNQNKVAQVPYCLDKI